MGREVATRFEAGHGTISTSMLKWDCLKRGFHSPCNPGLFYYLRRRVHHAINLMPAFSLPHRTTLDITHLLEKDKRDM